MSWHAQAACRGVDVDLFFPTAAQEGAEAAKAICEGCPVRVECLEAALERREEHGVWGGTTVEERTRIRRQRARARRAAATTRRPGIGTDACGTDAGYQRHRRRGERPCKSCRAAHAERERQRRVGAWA